MVGSINWGLGFWSCQTEARFVSPRYSLQTNPTNPPQGHPITTLRALRAFNHFSNMACGINARQERNSQGLGFSKIFQTWPCGLNARQERRCARWSQTHRTMHAPWLPSQTTRLLLSGVCAALQSWLSTHTEAHRKFFRVCALGRSGP